MLDRTFKAFQYPQFRLMWTGACVSSIGTWMQALAQSWLVLEISNDPFYLGLDSFLGQIPIFLFSLVGGVIADRFDRRRVLVGSQLVQMTCAFLLAALFASKLVQVWQILALSFCVGVAQAFGGPAYQALVPTLVKSEDLPNAIALNSIQFNLARIIGPVLGGLALTQLGASWCFSLNGVSYIAVIITLLLVQPAFFPKSSTTPILESMKQGISFVRGEASMVSLIVVAFLMTMLGFPMIVFLPVFARDIFHMGPDGLRNMMVVSGAGSILGALLVATFHHGRKKGRAAVLGLLGLGFLVLVFSASRILAVSLVTLFLGGAALMTVFAMISSLVQLITPDEMRGRVMSVYNVAFRGGMPFGSLIAGRLVTDLGAPPVIAASGVLLAILAIYLLTVHRKIYEL
ncbi:MAG: MFS transporter [Acidobacteria bacterium]|nr:MFS transporter [Acidobacteriota bacterium]